MSELKAGVIVTPHDEGLSFNRGSDAIAVTERETEFYLKSEADKVIKSITEGAISMFRDSNRCRGLDLESPLGRIANAAFKHWCFVESISSKNTQLQEDKERLLQNNHHLLDEVERLKEDVADARQKACGYQEIINEMERQERHHKYKRCLNEASYWVAVSYQCVDDKHRRSAERHHRKWLELAEQFKEGDKCRG